MTKKQQDKLDKMRGEARKRAEAGSVTVTPWQPNPGDEVSGFLFEKRINIPSTKYDPFDSIVLASVDDVDEDGNPVYWALSPTTIVRNELMDVELPALTFVHVLYDGEQTSKKGTKFKKFSIGVVKPDDEGYSEDVIPDHLDRDYLGAPLRVVDVGELHARGAPADDEEPPF